MIWQFWMIQTTYEFNYSSNLEKIPLTPPPTTRPGRFSREEIQGRYFHPRNATNRAAAHAAMAQIWKRRKTDGRRNTRERERVKIMTAAAFVFQMRREERERPGGRKGVRNITPFTKSGPCAIVIMYCLGSAAPADRAMRFHADYFNRAVSSTVWPLKPFCQRY